MYNRDFPFVPMNTVARKSLRTKNFRPHREVRKKIDNKLIKLFCSVNLTAE